MPRPGVASTAGGLYDTDSRVAAEPLEFGALAMITAAGLAAAPTDDDELPGGVVVRSDAHSQPHEMIDGVLQTGITATLMTRGRIWVRPESGAAAIGDPVHVRIDAESPAAAATLDLAPLTTNVDTIAAAAAAGEAGNDITLSLVGNGTGTGQLVEDEVSGSVVFHFLPDTTTVTNLQTALTASTLLAIGTAGTGANVLDETDAIGPTFLSGGEDAAAFTAGEFSNAPIADETMQIDTGARWVRAAQSGIAELEVDVMNMTFTADV